MSAKSYSMLAAVLFAILAAAQLVRAMSHTEVLVAGHPVPIAASWAAFGVLAVMVLLGVTAKRG